MQGVSPDDRTWLRTFPHHVEPEHDEWFPGVLLRCDQANHCSSGTTLCSLLGALHQERFSPKSHMIVVPSPVRELFAQMVGLPQERILATTYQTELARLYGMHNPHSRLLNAKLSFHLCPACMTHSRLLKRTLTLPHLTACSLHGLELQNRCRCGRSLVLFSRNALPFTCTACGWGWAHLPQIPLAPDRVERERHLNSLYEFFLVKGTSRLRDLAWEILRIHERRTSMVYLKRSLKFARPYGSSVSLGYVVEQMVNAGFSSDDISAYW